MCSYLQAVDCTIVKYMKCKEERDECYREQGGRDARSGHISVSMLIMRMRSWQLTVVVSTEQRFAIRPYRVDGCATVAHWGQGTPSVKKNSYLKKSVLEFVQTFNNIIRSL